MHKILIITNCNWHILFSSFDLINAIKAKNEQTQIHYLTHTNNKELVEQNNNIEKIFYAKQDYVQNVFELLKENYTYVIDLQADTNSFFTRHYLRHKFNANQTTVVYPNGILNRWFRKKQYFNSPHLSKNICKLCPEIAYKYNNKHFTYSVKDKSFLGKDDLPMAHLAGFCTVVLHTKLSQNELEKIKNIASNETMPIIFTGEENCKQIAQQLCQTNPIKLYNAIGKFNLYETQEIFCRATKNYTTPCNYGYLAKASPRPNETL